MPEGFQQGHKEGRVIIPRWIAQRKIWEEIMGVTQASLEQHEAGEGGDGEELSDQDLWGGIVG